MYVFKCKMCGGKLEINDNESVVECEYCGTQQTVPNADNEKKMKLYERANKLRYNCDFDKAAGIYENIVAEYPDEAEAYWGLVLCKYGIEYVDDPVTKKKVPTCHRTSFDSVMDDTDFEVVMENSDTLARAIYRTEAKQIEEIRKGIIAVSEKEEPYDIFICYKETAENGQRTIDSVLAQDVYEALTDKGYRVFFSRISLEDKIGQEYEPYIFAALHSAPIMLAFGTSYDYYNAVWVKNEWGRYLKLMETSKEKHLIPCYKDIDAYDIPKEFSKLQAQDMGKVGAIQDIIRGIEKLIGCTKTVVAEKTVSVQINSQEEALCKRGYMALEDKEWDSAKSYFNQALNLNAENGKAYLGTVMAAWECSVLEDTEHFMIHNDFETDKNFKRAMQFLDADTKQEFVCIVEEAKRKKAENEEKRKAERLVLEKKRKADRIIVEEKRRENNKAKGIIVTHNLYLKPDGTLVSDNKELKTWKKIKYVAQCIGGDVVGLTTDGKVISANTEYKESLKIPFTSPFETKELRNIKHIQIYDNRNLLAFDERNQTHLITKERDSECYKRIERLENIKKVIFLGVRSCHFIRNSGEYCEIDYSGSVKEKYSLPGVRQIKPGSVGSYFLKEDGTVSTFYNYPNYKENLNLYGWKDVVKILSVEGRHFSTECCALMSDGTVSILDPTVEMAVVGEWEQIAEIDGFGNLIMGLKADGTVVVAGEIDEKIKQKVKTWENVVDIYAHSSSNLIALTKDGRIFTTGKDNCAKNIKLFEDFDLIEEERKNIPIEADYQQGLAAMEEFEYKEALKFFEKIKDYKDVESLTIECKERIRIFDLYQKQINEARRELRSVQKRRAEYESQYSKLGVFSGKEKRRLTELIEQDREKEVDLSLKIEKIEKQQEDALSEDISNVGSQFVVDVSETGDYYDQIEIGSTIKYGSYPQKNNGDRKNIEWIVLDKKDGKALVISKYALECIPYNEKYADVNWNNCSLRKWLNNEFFNSAFLNKEKEKISKEMVTVSGRGPKEDKKVQDYIFLLSISEARAYISHISSCEPTDFVVAKGEGSGRNDGNYRWWLRSTSISTHCAAYFSSEESDDCRIEVVGELVHHDCAVRPAMWINLHA